MPEIIGPPEGEELLQRLHGLSAHMYLYQTNPNHYQDQLQQTQTDLIITVHDLFERKMENEIIQNIGPMLLSSLLPSIPQDSDLAGYIRTINELEPDTKALNIKELIPAFDQIFVLLGKKASGKGTVSKIMTEQYGIQGLATSDWLRGIARARNLPTPFNPVMLREIGDELRQEFGGDVLVWLTLQEFNFKGIPNVVFDGLRAKTELNHLSSATIIWVEAPDELRLERVKSRARSGDPQTPDDLKIVDQKSFPEADDLKSNATIIITNSSDEMGQLYEQVDGIMVNANLTKVRVLE
jgi:dephospho-CoA kinase